jgi:hypothetical protein
MKKTDLQTAATLVQARLRERGIQDVAVRQYRGALLLEASGHKVARLTPIHDGRIGLSYFRHTGRWEPLPVDASDPVEAADLAADLLSPHFQAAQDVFANH